MVAPLDLISLHDTQKRRQRPAALLHGAQWCSKFYRPAHWGDAQIAEEHGFTTELAAAELPVAAALTLAHPQPRVPLCLLPLTPRPCLELDAPEARQLLGRTLARLHQVGARRPFAVRPRIGIERLGWQARSQVLGNELLPAVLRERYSSLSGALLERVLAGFAAVGASPRLRGDCHLGNLLWNEP